MRSWLVLLACVGCNQLFDLQQSEIAVAPDRDSDGTPDTTDNCIDVANDQRDTDADGIGDACDNCVHVANSGQEHAGDGDALGDVCDPHPIDDGDCLLLVDSFSDPASFDAHWRVRSDDAVPELHIDAGAVQLVPSATSTGLAIVADDMPPVRLDVTVLATLPALTQPVAAFTNAISNTDGDRCIVQRETSGVPSILAYPSGLGPSSRAKLSSVPIREQFLLRHATRTLANGNFEMRCRVDYGVGVAAFQARTSPSVDKGGASGVITTHDPITIHAIAFSRFQPGVACPASIIR